MLREIALEGAVYQAAAGFEDHLEWELGGPSGFEKWGALYYRNGPLAEKPLWTANVWLEPFRLEFDSISDAARALRGKQRNWALFSHTAFRRSALIAEKLPPLSAKRRGFPWLLPAAPVGAWTLLDRNTLIGSARCADPFPGGRIEFEEDHEGPPSRAYLKLWEALVRARRWPEPGELCLDAGASPGGWSWALARLGARVLAVDRAAPDGRVFSLRGPDGSPLVRFIRHDAFTLKPGDIGPVDWLFCDAAAYPGRVYRWLETWLASGLARNYVCTIKMQGSPEADAAGKNAGARDGFAEGMAAARNLLRIAGGAVVHLYHNRHELAWILTRTKTCQEERGLCALPQIPAPGSGEGPPQAV